MRINNNIMAMNTHRQLGMGTAAGARSTERLSSGMRINRAGDDAAGLAISEKMRAQIRGLNQASRNGQDGISLIQTAEGALKETHEILQRMRELAVQASNDTNVDVDREEIQKEINQLTSEINRIGNTTEFNTMTLLDGSRSATATGETVDKITTEQIIVNTADGITVGDDSIELKDSQLEISEYNNFDWSDVADDSSITISTDNGNLTVDIVAEEETGERKLNVTDEFAPNWDENDEFTYNAHGVSFTITKEAFEAADDDDDLKIDFDDIKDADDSVIGTVSTADDWDDNDGNSEIVDYIAVDADRLNAEFGDAVASYMTIEFDGVGGDGSFTVTIFDADDNELSEDTYDNLGLNNEEIFNYDNHGINFDLKVNDVSKSIESNKLHFDTEEVAVTEDNSLSFQVGANENQAMGLSLSDMRAESLGISSSQTGTDGFTAEKTVADGTDATTVEYALDVSSHEAASSAVSVISQALEDVSAERSMLGSMQNRLDHTIKNLDTSVENLQAAESRIRDVDMAQEMMEFTKSNILQQAGQAMLAQANQAPQGVLQLLG